MNDHPHGHDDAPYPRSRAAADASNSAHLAAHVPIPEPRPRIVRTERVPWWDVTRRLQYALLTSRAYGARRRWSVEGLTTIAGTRQAPGLPAAAMWMLNTYMAGTTYVGRDERGRVVAGMTVGSLPAPTTLVPVAVTVAPLIAAMSSIQWLSGAGAMVSWALVASLLLGWCDMAWGVRKNRVHLTKSHQGGARRCGAKRAAREYARTQGWRVRHVVEAGNLAAEPGSGGLAFFIDVARQEVDRGDLVLIFAGDNQLQRQYARNAAVVPDRPRLLVMGAPESSATCLR